MHDRVMIIFKEQMLNQLHFTTLGILRCKTTWLEYGEVLIACSLYILL